MIPQIAITVGIAFAAEIVGTAAGFGSSTILLPAAAVLFDFKTALVLTAVFHLFGSISRVGLFRRSINKRLLLWFGVPSVALTVFGAVLAARVPQEALKGTLGIFLAAYAALSMYQKDLRLKQSQPSMAIGGGISGFLAGLIGTGGALRGAFLDAFTMPKKEYVGTAAAIALLVDLTRIPIYLKEGFLTLQYYFYIPLLLVVALFGAAVGKRLVRALPQKVFTAVVRLALFIVGIYFVISWAVDFVNF